MRRPVFWIGAAMLAVASPAALAVQPDEVLRDPALEQRARAISANLRCLVCQNQSIDESDAPLARDLRVLVRERLQRGEGDAEVTSFVVQRYGEFVLLRPVFGAHTLFLWLTPVLVLALGGLGLYGALRRRPAPSAPLDEREQAELDRVLGGRGRSDPA